jgi:hypothetical protein
LETKKNNVSTTTQLEKANKSDTRPVPRKKKANSHKEAKQEGNPKEKKSSAENTLLESLSDSVQEGVDQKDDAAAAAKNATSTAELDTVTTITSVARMAEATSEESPEFVSTGYVSKHRS